MDEKLKTFLSEQFGSHTLKGFVTLPLSNSSHNFSSYVQKVKIFLEKNNQELQLDLIVKTLPPKENDLEKTPKLKFKKEIEFYCEAVPEYRRIQINNNLPEQNLFPGFYKALEDLIFLEDLSVDGFYVHDSFLDEVQSKVVLKELAKFHATGIALKLTCPNIFEERLASVVTPALRNASNPGRDNINLEFRSEINKLLRSNKDLKDTAEAVDALLSKIDDSKLPTPCEPFSTLLHNDLWRGNIMFKKSSSFCGSFDVKFIDFQTVILNSPARDIIYFLFSSVDLGVLSNNFQDLLKYYHIHFVNSICDLGVESAEFNFNNLMTEINSYGPSKLKHLLLLFRDLSSVDADFNFEQCLQRIVFLFKFRGWL